MQGQAVCTAHQGRHGIVNDACWLPARDRPQPFRWRFVRCETCGVELDIRTEVRTGQSVTLVAGTDTPHRHEPPIRVALDPDDLADAIVRASRAARQERQPQQTTASVAAGPVATASPQDVAHGEIPAVAVWSPDEDGVG